VVAPVLSGAGIRSTAGTVRLNGASRVAANEIIAAGPPGATGQGAGIQAQTTVVDIMGASVIRDNVLDIDGHPGAAVATGAGLSLNGGMLTLDAGVIEINSAIAKGCGDRHASRGWNSRVMRCGRRQSARPRCG
jgi:hypothetical protein